MSNVVQLYREEVDDFVRRAGPCFTAEVAQRFAVTVEVVLPLLTLMHELGIVEGEPIETECGVEHVWMAL